MSYSGYSAAYREKGNTLFVAYYQELRDVFNENKIYTVDEIEKDFDEDSETGEMVDFKDLLSDFHDKTVKVSVTYDEDYE